MTAARAGSTLRSSAGAGFHALVPGGDVLVVLIQFLANHLAEVEEAEQQDIGHRDAVAANEFTAFHLTIQPGQLVLGGSFQPV